MIRYKKYQNQIPGDQKGLWYARTCTSETIDLSQLAEHMHNHNTPYSEGTIYGVLRDMVACVKELILEGKAVKIDNLGIFRAAIHGSGAKTAAEWKVAQNVSSIGVNCLPTGNLMTRKVSIAARLQEADVYSVDDGSTPDGGGSTPDGGGEPIDGEDPLA